MSDDQILIAGLKKKLPSAQERFYQIYIKKVTARCGQITKDDEAKHFLANESLCKAMMKINQFKGDSKLSTWVYIITTNTCLMFLKKENKYKHRFPFLEILDSYTQERIIGSYCLDEDFLAREKIQKSFNKIKENYKLAIIFSRVEKFDHDTTSKILGVTIPCTKTWLHRGINSFKQRLERAA